MKAPIIPIIILSINPVLESISLLAIQPDKAPSTNQAIIPICRDRKSVVRERV